MGVQDYTPGTLLQPGQLEVKVFNNLYTQTAFFNENREKIDQGIRSTYFTSITNVLYGIKANFNVGFDLYVKSVLNSREDSSPFSLFSFPSHNMARTAISAIAPKIKVAPFSSIPSLSFQTSVLFPLAEDLEGRNNDRPFLDYKGIQWWTQVFYDYSINEDWLLYFENDYFWRLDATAENFVTPLKAILQHYPTPRWVVYALGDFSPSWDGFKLSTYYGQAGVGAKYLILPFLEVESLFTIFPFGKNKGAGRTYNIGFRFLR